MFPGLLLLGIGSSKNGETQFEAIATEHPVTFVTNLATG